MILKLWTLRQVDQKYINSFEMWCWRRMENISWMDRVRNDEVLLRIQEERNILHTLNISKTNRIGHIFRRNCNIKHVIEGKIEGRIECDGKTRKK
jgi:hypothetical protein